MVSAAKLDVIELHVLEDELGVVTRYTFEAFLGAVGDQTSGNRWVRRVLLKMVVLLQLLVIA